jgi:hypothetical protein
MALERLRNAPPTAAQSMPVQCTEGCRQAPVNCAELLLPPRGPVIFDAALDDAGLNLPAAQARMLQELIHGHVKRLRGVFVDQSHDALVGAGPAEAARDPLQAFSDHRLPRQLNSSSQPQQEPGGASRATQSNARRMRAGARQRLPRDAEYCEEEERTCCSFRWSSRHRLPLHPPAVPPSEVQHVSSCEGVGAALIKKGGEGRTLRLVRAGHVFLGHRRMLPLAARMVALMSLSAVSTARGAALGVGWVPWFLLPT